MKNTKNTEHKIHFIFRIGSDAFYIVMYCSLLFQNKKKEEELEELFNLAFLIAQSIRWCTTKWDYLNIVNLTYLPLKRNEEWGMRFLVRILNFWLDGFFCYQVFFCVSLLYISISISIFLSVLIQYSLSGYFCFNSHFKYILF